MLRLPLFFIFLCVLPLQKTQQDGKTLLEYFDSIGGVSLEYTLNGISEDGRISIRQSGTAEIQERSYHIKNSGVEIFCDGETLYLYSEDNEEVIISNDESIPLLSASSIKKNAKGEIEALYKDANGISYTVLIHKLEPLSTRLPNSHFVFSGLDNPNLIITDIR